MRVKAALAALLCAAAIAGSAAAQTPEALRVLADCRSVQLDSERLACFDAAAARLTAATQAGAVVVLDREQVRAARRQAFGFNLPSLNILGGDEPGVSNDRVELLLADARQASDGRWVFRTQDGQVWRQTDSESVRGARPGTRALVRRAALGSFLMNIGGQRAIRVRREQ